MSDYREVLQNPQLSFSNLELQEAEIKNSRLGLPVLVSGGFALTACATLKSSRSKSQWAIRCFHKEVPDFQERYQYISNFLNRQNEDFLVKFTYEPQGIKVHGQSYPIIKMAWVDGLTLNQYVEKHIKKPKRLLALADEIKRISKRISQLQMGHGDLQNGNILVRESGNCVLVDYDGIYVLGMPYSHSNETGHPSFQHPERNSAFFNDRMDDFSLIVIWTSLIVLATSSGSELWKKYYDSERLIFSKEDYKNPDQSPLFSELVNHPQVGNWVKRLKHLCSSQIQDIPRLDKFLDLTFTLPQTVNLPVVNTSKTLPPKPRPPQPVTVNTPTPVTVNTPTPVTVNTPTPVTVNTPTPVSKNQESFDLGKTVRTVTMGITSAVIGIVLVGIGGITSAVIGIVLVGIGVAFVVKGIGGVVTAVVRSTIRILLPVIKVVRDITITIILLFVMIATTLAVIGGIAGAFS